MERDDSRKLANGIVSLRKFAKQEWLVGVLRKAAEGDFAAVRCICTRLEDPNER